MADVIFYEKPGCINNTRQKKILIKAGHTVVAKSLLTEDWHGRESYLRAFFGVLPVEDWFNRSAPAVKQGFVIPERMTEQQAIDAMIDDPLLIRRPLMHVGDEQRVGFDDIAVDEWIGLGITETQGDLESCPQTHTASSCKHD
jgi:nitrogenase-associated protein